MLPERVGHRRHVPGGSASEAADGEVDSARGLESQLHGCDAVFGKRVTQAGKIPQNFGGALEVDLKQREEGKRVKFHLNWNSCKFYDKAYTIQGSVLRAAETTINQVKDFRVYRPVEGGAEDDLQWRPMRMGIADLHRRAEVSQKSNERLMDALASVDESRSSADIMRSPRPTTHDRLPTGAGHVLVVRRRGPVSEAFRSAPVRSGSHPR